MASFPRRLASLGRHGLSAVHMPCRSFSMAAASPQSLSAAPRGAARLLQPSLGCSQLFSSLSPRAAQRAKPRSNPIPRAKPPSSPTPKPQPRTAPAAPPSGAARRSPLSPATAATTAAATAASAAASSAAAIRTFADQLGRRAAPTLLYQAPSHFWFRMSCTSAGTFCIGYTIVNYWSIYLRPPPDLVWWVPHAFGVICVVMAGLGGYFILGGARIIRSIHAVPASRIDALAGPGVAAKAAKAAGGTPIPVFLEVEIGRMLPVLPARKLYVQPSAVALPFRLVAFGIEGGRIGGPESTDTGVSSSPATGYERVLARRTEEERRKKAHEYEMNHLMTAPFRHAWQGARVAWGGIRRAFSREGFVPAEVDGQKYKLDVTGGWALEGGRALDRLVTIKEGQL